MANSSISHLLFSLCPRSKVIFGHSYTLASLWPSSPPEQNRKEDLDPAFCGSPLVYLAGVTALPVVPPCSESDSVPGGYGQLPWKPVLTGGWGGGGGVGGTKDSRRAFVGQREPGADLWPGNLRAGFVSISSRSLSAVSVENSSEA